MEVAVKRSFGKHKYTVIFLHGLGGSGEEWIRVLKPQIPPNVKLICPKSFRRAVTFKGGEEHRSWFDLKRFDPSEIEEDEDSLSEATDLIKDIVIEEIEDHGILKHNIILGGIDQGGALAISTLFSLARWEIQLGGLLLLSTWIPQGTFQEFTHRRIPEMPIFQGHGERDRLISIGIGRRTHKELIKYSDRVTFKVYDRRGTVDFTSKVVFDIGDWLREIF